MKDQARIWRYAFAMICLLTLALEVLPGRLAFFDEVFFKAAGRHWAATGSFSAPEIVGRVHVQPGIETIYFAQPPLYTFAFGLYTKLVGFGPHRCILFDALIHILLAFCTIQLARRVFQAPASFSYASGIIVLFLGTRGRPDELALCIAIAGILCWTLEIATAWRAVLSGVAFGLCGASSIGVWLFLSPLALLVAHHRGVLNRKTFLQAILSGALVAAFCVAPILVPYPLAYRQLMAHAADQSPQMGEIITAAPGQQPPPGIHQQDSLRRFVDREVQASEFAVRFGPAITIATIGTLLLFVFCIHAMPKEEARFWRQCAVAAWSGILVLWLMMPGKYTYLWFFGPWLLCLSAAVLARSYANLRPVVRAAVVLTAVLFLVPVMALYAKDRTIMLALPRQQAFYPNMAHVREVIPAGARVVTGEYWWAIADKCLVLDPNLSSPAPLDFDYMVKSGNGSGAPGKPVVFAEYFEAFAKVNHFVVVEDDLNRSPLSIGHLRLTHSAWGFGPYILARGSDRTRGTEAAVSGLPNSAAH